MKNYILKKFDKCDLNMQTIKRIVEIHTLNEMKTQFDEKDAMFFLLAENYIYGIGAYVDDILIGYIFLIDNFYECDDVYIANFEIHPLYQNKGMGMSLVNEAVETFIKPRNRKVVVLDVEKQNVNKKFYDKLGLKNCDKQSKMGDDCFVMQVDLMLLDKNVKEKITLFETGQME